MSQTSPSACSEVEGTTALDNYCPLHRRRKGLPRMVGPTMRYARSWRVACPSRGGSVAGAAEVRFGVGPRWDGV